jgi:hypothetical protein
VGIEARGMVGKYKYRSIGCRFSYYLAIHSSFLIHQVDFRILPFS